MRESLHRGADHRWRADKGNPTGGEFRDTKPALSIHPLLSVRKSPGEVRRPADSSHTGNEAVERAINSNALGLDEKKLNEVAVDVRDKGLTREQLFLTLNKDFAPRNPIFAHNVESNSAQMGEKGQDNISFNRGFTLAYIFVDGTSEGGAPALGIRALELFKQARARPKTQDAFREACDHLLVSQTFLSEAFDKGLAGLPEGTDRDMARFGGGYYLIGALAAAEFGGMLTEAWFEPNTQ